jgi:hypothetical protein
MRILMLIVLGGLAFADNTAPADKSFALELSWSRQEHSMDSNGQSEKWTLAGDKLSWTWSYSGYHPSRDFVRNKKKTVKVKDPSKLHALAEQLASVKDVKLGENQHQTITVGLKMTLNGKATTLSVSGYPQDKPPEDWKKLDQLRQELSSLIGD